MQHQTLESARADATARRDVRKAQSVGSVTELILPDAVRPAPRPQAFLVEQSADWTLPVHFHLEHQFQVFVAGGGTIGREPVTVLDVHYASPHAAYGPLVSGGAGVSYLTLRAVGDTGAWYLPEMREKCLRIPKVQAHVAPRSPVPRDLPGLAGPQQETLIEPRPSGLAAWIVRLGAGQSHPQPVTGEPGGGRFVVVTQGRLEWPGTRLPGLSVAWVGADEPLGDLVAGDGGLEAVVLQFPAEAARSFVEAQAAPAQP